MSVEYRFRSLLNYAQKCGLTFEFHWNYMEDKGAYNAGVVRQEGNHFAIFTNKLVTDAKPEIKFAALAHELGHALVQRAHNESEADLIINVIRRGLGHQSSIDAEIDADRYGCLVSKIGMLKILRDSVAYDKSKELKQRLTAAESFSEGE